LKRINMKKKQSLQGGQLEGQLQVLLYCHCFLKVGILRRNLVNKKRLSRKVQLGVLNWLSAVSLRLTLSELKPLYSLLSPTGKIWRTSKREGEISTLLHMLRKKSLEIPLSTSQSWNFKNVELFISMLSSGALVPMSLSESDVPEWLRGFGVKDLSI